MVLGYSLRVYDGDNLLDEIGPGFSWDAAEEEARFLVHRDGATSVDIVPDSEPDRVSQTVRAGRP